MHRFGEGGGGGACFQTPPRNFLFFSLVIPGSDDGGVTPVYMLVHRPCLVDSDGQSEHAGHSREMSAWVSDIAPGVVNNSVGWCCD